MTLQDTVKLVDPSARFHAWGDVVGNIQPGWVKGTGWETKICNTETRAWELASDLIATRQAA